MQAIATFQSEHSNRMWRNKIYTYTHCPECHGHGYLHDGHSCYKMVDGKATHISTPDSICQTCNGKGEVKISKIED